MVKNGVILKISGEALGNKENTYSESRLNYILEEVRSLVSAGLKPLIVLGGGNIYRGRTEFFQRVTGDYIGMLATIMNSLALSNFFNKNNVKSQAYSSIEMERVLPLFRRELVVKDIENNIIPIFGGGTANPYFSTDSLATLRAAELGIKLILKGSTIDGIYDEDPKKFKDAKKFDTLLFSDALKMDLGIIFDQAAFYLAQQNKTEVVIYDFFTKGNSIKAYNKKTGTYVRWEGNNVK